MKNQLELMKIRPRQFTKSWLFFRKVNIFKLLFVDREFRAILKKHVNLAYRNFLGKQIGIKIVPPASLNDFSKIKINLESPQVNEGNTSFLEMLCLIALTKKYIQPGKNFLEIGTYDGNMALNIAINIPPESTVITIDLPEGSDANNALEYDNYLIINSQRANKKHLHLPNVRQIYADSTKFDFSKIDFSCAFIDGGHDIEVVRSDTINVLNNIQSPGFIAWHDYETECDVGDLLHAMLGDYDVCHIEGTRMAFLEV